MFSASLLFAIILTILGVALFGIWGFLFLSKKLWPVGTKVAWSSGHIQRSGQTYEQTLSKVRIIDRIKVIQGQAGQFNKPKKWRLTIVEKDCKNWHEYEGYDFIEVTLGTPLKVIGLSFVIIEPRLPNDRPKAQTWAFEDIKIREVRLFGRYWRKEVHAM